MTKIVAVISGKGGVGKTTIVSNIAAALSKAGKHVLVIDGNVSGPNLATHLGVPETHPVTLNDVIKNEAYILHAIYQHPVGFKVIPASMAELEAELGGLEKHLSRLIGVYDLILIDSAPGVNDEVRAAVEASDEVVLVTTPELPSVQNAKMAADFVRKLGKEVAGVIVNMHRGEKHELKPHDIESVLNARVLGVVKEHGKVRGAISKGIPVYLVDPYIKPSREIRKIAYLLLEENPPKESFTEKLISLLKTEVHVHLR